MHAVDLSGCFSFSVFKLYCIESLAESEQCSLVGRSLVVPDLECRFGQSSVTTLILATKVKKISPMATHGSVGAFEDGCEVFHCQRHQDSRETAC